MDTMGKFLFGLLALLILAVCFFVGMLPASAVSGGASSVLGFGLLAAVIMSGFSIWIAWMIADMETGRPRLVATICGAIAFATTMWLPADTIINGQRYAAYARYITPIVRAYVLANFHEIDTDDSGVITDEEMSTALSRLTLSQEQRQALEFMRGNQSEAGHVIDSYTTTTYVWISTGPNGAGYMSPIITTHYIYGISRRDLEGYPERTIEKWKHW
jgi:hypothetical protein